MKKYLIENDDGSQDLFPFEEPEKTTTAAEDATALVLMWGRDTTMGLSDEELEEQKDLILGACDFPHLEDVINYLAAALSTFVVGSGKEQGLSPTEALDAWAEQALRKGRR